jgi:hypothetical protein
MLLGCGEQPDKEWSEAALIDKTAGLILDPDVAVDASGAAITLWARLEDDAVAGDSRAGVWASRFQPSSGWSEPAKLETNIEFLSGHPRVAVDRQGNAIAMWGRRVAGNLSDLVACRYTAGAGWGTVTSVARVRNGYLQAQAHATVKVGPAGHVFALWQNAGSGSQPTTWAARFVPESGWEAALPISSWACGEFCDIAVDASGNATVAWIDGSQHRPQTILFARYEAGRGWSAAADLPKGSAEAQPAGPVELVLDASGSPVAAWSEVQGYDATAPVTRWVSRWSPDRGWNAAIPLSPPTTRVNAMGPFLTGDGGDPLAIWFHSFSFWARAYSSASGWDHPAETLDLGDVPNSLRVAGDGHGLAFGIWSKFIERRNASLSVIRYSVADGWDAPIELAPRGVIGADLAVGANGSAWAVWTGAEGAANNLWARHRGP